MKYIIYIKVFAVFLGFMAFYELAFKKLIPGGHNFLADGIFWAIFFYLMWNWRKVDND